MSKPTASILYRPDIDGLRALAVISVVLYHAFPTVFKGGFAGVDVFFVISGYLITSILLKDIEAGRFSIFNFYLKRVLRLFPALIFVCFFVFIFGWFSLQAEEYSHIGKHILGSTFFVSNFVSLAEANYFDVSSEVKPLLHLWSLAIEEQFYILWPFVILYFHRTNKLRFASGVILVVSFLLNLAFIFISKDQSTAFYMPAARFWEIMLGTQLAIPNTVFNLNKIKMPVKNLNLWGLLILVITVFTFSSNKFPGWKAMFPCLATLCLISSQNSFSDFIKVKILTHKFLVFIGVISYPLYLWHWPLFSYAHLLFGTTPPIIVSILLIILSFVLAWLTYHYIEKPIKQSTEKTKIFKGLVLSMACLSIMGFAAYINNGFANRYVVTKNDLIIRQWNMKAPIACDAILNKTSSAFCMATTEQPNIAVIGDSHAGHLFYGFSVNKNDFFNKVIVMGAGDCQASLDVEVRKGCNYQLLASLKKIEETPSIKYVYIAGYGVFFEKLSTDQLKKYFEGLERTINYLVGLNRRVFFVIDNPALKETAERCFTPNLFVRKLFKETPLFCEGAQENDLLQLINYREFATSLIKKTKILAYDSKPFLCNKNTCLVKKDGFLLYGDNNHLSIYGSKFVVEDLIQENIRLFP